MIISEKIEIIINSQDFKILKPLEEYKNIKIGDMVEISVKLLKPTSLRKVYVECDICGTKLWTPYGYYNRNFYPYEIYCCCRKCSLIKVQNTNLKKLGVKCSFQSEIVKDKIKLTNIKLYGFENVSKNDDIKQKKINTCLKNYKVKNPMHSQIIKDRLKNKINILFGCDNVFQNEKIKKLIRENNIKIHGVEYTAQTQISKDNAIKTCLLKFGTEHASQNEEIFTKQQKSGFLLKFHENTQLYYRGTYEKHFLDFCFQNNIKIKKGKRIIYYLDGKKHYYFSDFLLEEINLIIEIKSSYTYKRELLKNEIKKEYSIKEGYSFIFIIDKDYNNFINIIKNPFI